MTPPVWTAVTTPREENLLTLEKDLANTLGLNIDDFNQRIKVHDHLANLVLQFLQQHHTSLAPAAQTDDMVKKFNDLNRAHELLQAQYSASLRASTSPTMTNQKDDAELVTPPPVNHTPSSSPASSLPTASAAALDGKSFDSVVQPRIFVVIWNRYSKVRPRCGCESLPTSRIGRVQTA